MHILLPVFPFRLSVNRGIHQSVSGRDVQWGKQTAGKIRTEGFCKNIICHSRFASCLSPKIHLHAVLFPDDEQYDMICKL